MRDAVRLDAIIVQSDASAGVITIDGARARSGINPTQRVGGRLFIMRDSTWTDLSHGDSLHVVSIAAYSEAYFALLKALPGSAGGRRARADGAGGGTAREHQDWRGVERRHGTRGNWSAGAGLSGISRTRSVECGMSAMRPHALPQSALRIPH